MMNSITRKYTKEDLEAKGIWINYLINPSTFAPCITIFSVDDKESFKEFEKETTREEIDKFIDEWVDEILMKKRNRKITKILKNDNI